MDVTGPRYSTTTADLGSGLGSLKTSIDPATGQTTSVTTQTANDFQSLSPETKAILATIVDLLSGKFSSNFALDYQDADGNADSIQQTTQLPGILEFESGEADTQVAGTAFGPDAEMHILTKGGNDEIELMANNLRIVTGDGNDVIKADAMYLSAALSGAGDDLMYLSAVTLGDILAGEGNDMVDAWGNFVGNVDGEAGDDLLTVGGREIWFVNGGEGNDNVGVSGEKIGHVSGGEGDDLMAVEARANSGKVGGDVDDVGGGAGNDSISVAGVDVGWVHGDAGADIIEVTADQVGSVEGGEGNDQITVNGLKVGSVSGGDGDDSIVIQAPPVPEGDEATELTKLPAVEIRTGAGNDTVFADRAADVYFGLGDGQDIMTLTQGGRVVLSDGLEADPTMEMYRSGSLLQITWGNGDALILEIAPEDQMSVSIKDNVISITPIMTAATDETA